MLNEESLQGIAIVIGAGTMGGGIAAQLANAGWQVRLLDVPGPDPNDRKSRNQAAAAGLERILKSRPPLLFLPEYAERIRIGNTLDNLDWLRDADWVVEAVAEKMEVKQSVLAAVEAHYGPQTVVSSNTSGLSLRGMAADRSLDFRSRFLGSHFLNPPRYLKLLEVIPTDETDPAVTEGFVRFAEQVLGHRCVIAKDTPGFISTRIWILHLLDSIRLAVQHDLTVEEADSLTGPLIGRPRSATFRMADIVGLDIIAAIAQNQYAALTGDPFRDHLLLPEVVQRLIAEGRVGEKSGAGFYRREGREILALDFGTMEYRPRQEPQNPAVEALLKVPLGERLRRIEQTTGEPWAEFLRTLLNALSDYVFRMAPEFARDTLSVDRVMRWGFGWELGPFESAAYRQRDTASGESPGGRTYRVFEQAEPQSIPDEPEYIVLADVKAAHGTVLDSPMGSLLDLGDEVACLEFHSKMNTFDPALCAFVNAARERAERDFRALVIGNQGAHFSAGYNLRALLDAAEAGQWDALEAMMREVQATFMALKGATVPVVAAPHGYTLGAGCECALHCVSIQAAPELVMGLPELNAGVVPTGGGVKEMLARAMQAWDDVSDPFPLVEQVFRLLVPPRNSSSAAEAQKMGFLRASDGLSRNADRLLYEAKQRALALANAGYRPPVQQNIRVLGADGLARLRMNLHGQFRSGVLTEHDHRIADRIANILTGGLPYAREVSEAWLLHLEREAFLSLIGEPKSRERMRHLLETGKPLRN